MEERKSRAWRVWWGRDGERGGRGSGVGRGVASLPFPGRMWRERRRKRRTEVGSAGKKALSADRARQRRDSCDRRAQSWSEGRSGHGGERMRGRESRSAAATATRGQSESTTRAKTEGATWRGKRERKGCEGGGVELTGFEEEETCREKGKTWRCAVKWKKRMLGWVIKPWESVSYWIVQTTLL